MKPPQKPATEKINKSAFVRSLPATMSAQDVVKAAKAKGIKLSDKFVPTIRYNAKVSAAKKAGKSAAAGSAASGASAPVRRGPGRPRTVAHGGVRTGLEAMIENIVEAKVNELLQARLGALFGA